MTNVKIIYDIHSCVAGNDNDKNYAYNYMLPFMNADSRKSIANIITKSAILDTGGHFFPVTVNEKEYDNCYVCSPYTLWISYAKEELGKLGNKPLEFVLRMLLNGLGPLLKKADINKVVSINNWMLSTNLYPDCDGRNVADIKNHLIQTFPDYALMFRSLNIYTNPQLMSAFIKDGFILVPSRQVYIFDQKLSHYLSRHNTKIDFAMLQKTKYTITQHENITENDYPRILELYNSLYLDKYSYHNPQFTIECISHWHKKRLLLMKGLRNETGILDGIVGCFERNGITTAPLVGYDTGMPKNLALYRMLIALVLKHTNDNNLVLNLSSGASDFKILRGGQPFIEYSAIYIGHLPLFKKSVWHLMNLLLTYLAAPIMKDFKL